MASFCCWVMAPMSCATRVETAAFGSLSQGQLPGAGWLGGAGTEATTPPTV